MNARDYTARYLANMPAERRAQLEAEWLHPDAILARRQRERAEYEHQRALENGK